MASKTSRLTQLSKPRQSWWCSHRCHSTDVTVATVAIFPGDRCVVPQLPLFAFFVGFRRVSSQGEFTGTWVHACVAPGSGAPATRDPHATSSKLKALTALSSYLCPCRVHLAWGLTRTCYSPVKMESTQREKDCVKS